MVINTRAQLKGQQREREHRRRELLFRHACEFTHDRMKLIADKRRLSDDIIVLDEYYRRLSWLFDNGRLPPDVITERLIGASASVTNQIIATDALPTRADLRK